MKFHFEIIIGDRYEATDYLSDDEVHQSLLKMQKQDILKAETGDEYWEDICLLYTSPSPRDATLSRMPSSA